MSECGYAKIQKISELSKRPEIQMSRIQRAYQQLFSSEAPEPPPAPVYAQKLGTKQEGLDVYFQWLRLISPTDICAYSDGSSEGHDRSSWGYVLQRGGITFDKGNSILHGGEIYDAVLLGAAVALHAALSARRDGEKIHVLLDNQAAVGALQTGKTSSSIKLTRTVYDVAQKAKAEIRWLPGYSGIPGNEEADGEARSTLNKLPPRQLKPTDITLAYLRRLMYQRRQELVDDWWSKFCPARYRDLDLQMRRRKPPELALPRWLLHRLIAARTGLGDVAS